jgi:aryl-alcohol dehydrogenase-like predicted oxidoreductase
MTYLRVTGVARPLTRLILGTMSCSTDDLAFSFELLDRYVALGGNTLDTAHVYRRGAAERAVGAWLAARGNREEIVLIGKGAHHDADGPRVTPEAITADLLDSLDRLGTAYIDLYLLHRDDPSRPVGPIVECLNEHLQAGRIRAFGGSNWTQTRMAAANAYAAEKGLAGFVAGSQNFSLAVPNEPPWPGCVAATIDGWDWYERNRVPLLAWSSQAQGFFTGRYSPDDQADAEMVRVWYSEDNFLRLARADDLGRRLDVSANTVALAYVLARPWVAALIGPLSVTELESSWQALEVRLTAEETRWLNLEG